MDRVGVYLRISDDRDGQQSATARQAEDCRKYATAKGWEVVDVFEDVDLSAFKRTVRRPEFERMLAAVRDRQIDGVLAWKIDRITRRQRDLVRLDEACEAAGAFIATAADQIDTRQPTGRFVAELLVAQARMESENTSIRVASQHAERARRGDASAGGTRPFGHSSGFRSVVREEADLIRDAMRRLFAGESLRGICIDWDRQGVRSPAGKAWGPSSLRRVLMRASLSGQREHRGTLTQGTWPAIVSPDETARLRAILTSDERRTSRTNARRYLLSGFLRCGRCSAKLVARPRADGTRRYVCAAHPGIDNCGRLARLAEPVEQVVTGFVFAALDGADLAAYMRAREDGPGEGLYASIRSDEEALEQLSRDHYVDKVIGRAEFFAARDAIQARLDANRASLARRSGREMLGRVAGASEQVARQWQDASLDWKRAVIAAVIDHVVILPVGRGRQTFDVEAVRPVWRF